ncbi:hypothetical protein Droror1_Dr00014236 [Drosera rotundifolia]
MPADSDHTTMPADSDHTTETSPPPATAANGVDTRLLDEVLPFVPISAAKDLVSDGVCFRCILRLFGKYGRGCSLSAYVSCSVPSLVGGGASSDSSRENDGLSVNRGSNGSPISGESLNEPDICCICCGILQFRYLNRDKGLVKHNSASEFASSIFQIIKEQGHQPDGFSLEVSIPPFSQERENTARHSVEKKYGSDSWFQESLQSEVVSIKEALKFSIKKDLETLLGAQCSSSSFRINLTFTCSEGTTNYGKSMDKGQTFKRRKTGSDSNEEVAQVELNSNEHPFMNGGTLSRCSNSLQETSESCNGWNVKALPCCLKVHPYRTPVFIGGRYLKYSRNVSQTRWIIGEERKGLASVEEIVGGAIFPICKCDTCKFHAAGREDIDVRMLGSGRPFLVEIQNARVIPSTAHLKDMEEGINSLDNRLVTVKNLKIVDNEGWALMREGEAEKQKEYVALVWISRPVEDEDLCTLSSFKDMKIVQRTPIRVLHRRSPLDREKIIHWMNIEKIAGNPQYFFLRLCTQAGTYIKEFVHGDLGRTHPSIGSICGCRAEILQLDVTDVKMDSF